MKMRTVPSSWFEKEGRRLDCGPYMSGAIEAKVLLEKLPVRKAPLCKVTKDGMAGIYHAGREARNYVDNPKYGVPFLRSASILSADLSWLPLISKKQVEQTPGFTIREKWTLITRSGTIGKMAYVRPQMDGLACSEDVLRVIPDPEKILPGYLYAYLSSRFGVPLVVSGTYGAIIQHIEPSHIADLPVPVAPMDIQEKAHDKIQRSAEQLSQYQRKIQQATGKLFDASGAYNPPRFDWLSDNSDLSFSVSSNDLHTFRALNHSRRAKKIVDRIKTGRWSALEDVVDKAWLRWRKMFQRIDSDPEHGIEVLTQKPLFRLYPEGRWISRNYLLAHSPEYVVPDQTILIAKQGTLGEDELYCRTEFITGTRALARAYSDHCMRLVAMDGKILSGYLFAFLRSEAGFRLLRSISEGSKQQDLHYRTIAMIPVPRCDEQTEAEIHEMIVSAYRDKNEAIELEIEARKEVERWISKSSGN